MLSPRLCLHGNMEDKMADSIDVLMCLMFEFINEVCYNDGKYHFLLLLHSLPLGQFSLDSACGLFQSFIKVGVAYATNIIIFLGVFKSNLCYSQIFVRPVFNI